MIRLIGVAGFALVVATSAQGATFAPISQPDSMITQVAFGCGPNRAPVFGVCVLRTSIPQARPGVRKCTRWHRGVCALHR